VAAFLARFHQARQQVAALAAQQLILLAVGSGAAPAAERAQWTCCVLQVLGPNSDEVGCVS
jgi:hypothetical protein